MIEEGSEEHLGGINLVVVGSKCNFRALDLNVCPELPAQQSDESFKMSLQQTSGKYCVHIQKAHLRRKIRRFSVCHIEC